MRTRNNPGLRHLVVTRLLHILERKNPPFRSEQSKGAPIFLVHGLAGSHLALRPLGRHLARALDRPVMVVRIGLASRDIRTSAARVYREVERTVAESGCEYVDVVGHSLGGLVASYLLKQTDRGRLIRRVVTLGSPHRGTPSAWYGVVFLGLVCPCMWQIRPRAAFLRRLESTPVPPQSEIVAVAALEDTVVPARFALLRRQPRQRNRAVTNLDHFGLIISRAGHRMVSDVLSEDLAPQGVISLDESRAPAGAEHSG